MQKDGGRQETQGRRGEALEGSSGALPDYFDNEKNKAKPLKQSAGNYPSFSNFFFSSIIQNCFAFLNCLV